MEDAHRRQLQEGPVPVLLQVLRPPILGRVSSAAASPADAYVFGVHKFGKRDGPADAAEDGNSGFTKNEGSVLDIELDADIEGQEIPEIEENDQDVDDFDAWLVPDEE
ncbi:hypothetical protein V2A60_004836 [Cordyceps javanica]|uniref:Uncharacterized protein n=1 Tax=Cordyceps javanica TaxID=43265 RepID=A0A545WAE3_9HYPO|nr:hypothetical protein IF1G_01573 [Cordyceps javanica]TQW10961.1 hypothetical protein IF2G_01903 [Cordyceps javanica]